jgi:hypothetical protein
MKMQFAFNVIVGASVNLAFQLADVGSVPGKQFDFMELSTCIGLVAIAAFFPDMILPAIRTLLGNRRVTCSKP